MQSDGIAQSAVDDAIAHGRYDALKLFRSDVGQNILGGVLIVLGAVSLPIVSGSFRGAERVVSLILSNGSIVAGLLLLAFTWEHQRQRRQPGAITVPRMNVTLVGLLLLGLILLNVGRAILR